jgi:sigma-54 specific flagellar transcriptional regulator A
LREAILKIFQPSMKGASIPALIGRSEPMRVLRELIQTVAPSRATVLITGESGTGKELVAQALHAGGPRQAGPFIPINCGAIPKDLLESELFGHRRGAFTGALAHRTGRFELAHGGTLFLDEVGDLPVDTQVKLLRVLQERRIEPLGSADSLAIDVRIIAATNRDLERDVQVGRFREDLFYRLNVIPMRTAPLRERPEDVPELLAFFAAQHGEAGQEPITFGECLMQALCGYEWPGNVRELSNLVDRFSALYPAKKLRLENLPEWMLPPALARAKACDPGPRAGGLAEVGIPSPHDAERGSDSLAWGHEPRLHAQTGLAEPVGGTSDAADELARANPAENAVRMALGLEPLGERGVSLRERINDIERGFIEQALLRTRGNVSQAARLLCLQRTTLIEKLQKHGLKRPCS